MDHAHPFCESCVPSRRWLRAKRALPRLSFYLPVAEVRLRCLVRFHQCVDRLHPYVLSLSFNLSASHYQALCHILHVSIETTMA